jgi:hypothetical protein
LRIYVLEVSYRWAPSFAFRTVGARYPWGLVRDIVSPERNFDCREGFDDGAPHTRKNDHVIFGHEIKRSFLQSLKLRVQMIGCVRLFDERFGRLDRSDGEGMFFSVLRTS